MHGIQSRYRLFFVMLAPFKEFLVFTDYSGLVVIF